MSMGLMSDLRRRLPLLADYRGSGPSAMLSDFATGLCAGLVLWPIILGQTAIAGLPPSVSVGTAVLPVIAYALVGSSPLLVMQTGATLSLCIGELNANPQALDMTPEEIASVLALMVGAMHLLLGALDLASITELFSQPLLKGRTFSAALIVLASQFRALAGLTVPAASSAMPVVQFAHLAMYVPTAHLSTCLISLGLMAMLLLFRRLGAWASAAGKAADETSPGSSSAGGRDDFGILPTVLGAPQSGASSSSSLASSVPAAETVTKAVPFCAGALRCCKVWARRATQAAGTASGLLVLAAGALAYHICDDPAIQLVPQIREPRLGPQVRIRSVGQLVPFVPVAALIAFMSVGGHLVTAERVRRPQDTLDNRRELFALGLSNFATVLGGGMPAMPNFAASMALKNCTGRCALIGIAIGHLAAFLVLSSAPQMQVVPKCAIASILFVEFFPIVREAPRDLKHLFAQARLHGPVTLRSLLASDFGIYMAAAVSPLLLGVIQGFVLAIVLELLVAVSRFAGAGYTLLGRIPGTDIYEELDAHDSSGAEELPCVRIVRYSGPRWFGNVAATTRSARRERRAITSDKVIVADMSMVPFLDETAIIHYKREWPTRSYRIIVTNCCARVRKQWVSSGLAQMFPQPPETLTNLHRAVCYAEEMLRQEQRGRRAGREAAAVEAEGLRPRRLGECGAVAGHPGGAGGSTMSPLGPGR